MRTLEVIPVRQLMGEAADRLFQRLRDSTQRAVELKDLIVYPDSEDELDAAKMIELKTNLVRDLDDMLREAQSLQLPVAVIPAE